MKKHKPKGPKISSNPILIESSRMKACPKCQFGWMEWEKTAREHRMNVGKGCNFCSSTLIRLNLASLAPLSPDEDNRFKKIRKEWNRCAGNTNLSGPATHLLYCDEDKRVVNKKIIDYIKSVQANVQKMTNLYNEKKGFCEYLKSCLQSKTNLYENLLEQIMKERERHMREIEAIKHSVELQLQKIRQKDCNNQ